MSASANEVRAQSRELWSLQYLRAIAALSLVAYHTLEAKHCPDPILRVATDGFFVISGYLAWLGAGSKDIVSPLNFVSRRVVRLAPMYWIITLGAFVAASIRPGLYWMVDTRPEHLLKSLLFIPDFDRHGILYPVVLQSWVLQTLLFLFVAFAACLFLPRRFRLLVFTGLMAALVIAGHFISNPSAPVATYTNPFVLQFAAGMWLCELTRRLPPAEARDGLIAILLGCAILFGSQLLHDVIAWRILLYGAAALLFVGGLIAIEKSGKLGRAPWLKWIGDAAFAIYLIHVLVLEPTVRLFPNLPVPLTILLVLIESTIAGLMVYEFVEKPIAARVKVPAAKPRLQPAEQTQSPLAADPTANAR